MPRYMNAKSSDLHADAEQKTVNISEAELAAAAAAHKVPLDQAGPWAEHDRACIRWKHRVFELLMDMLCTPTRYAAAMEKLRRAKYVRPSSHDYIAAFDSALESVRADLLDMAPHGLGGVWVTNEIMGQHGNRLRFDIIHELACGGWLPMRPPSPNAQARKRDPQTDAERQARAEELAGTL